MALLFLIATLSCCWATEVSSSLQAQRVIARVTPLRMSPKHLRPFRHSRWLPFWLNLKEGYDHFAKTKRPPLVMVQEQRYVFTQP
jgi:murein L,D-transpeptidase YafK